MRGIRTKLCELCKSIVSMACIYDIIVFVETWLTGEISSSELGFKDFNVFRLDRSADTSAFVRGGGVLIAIKKILFRSTEVSFK